MVVFLFLILSSAYFRTIDLGSPGFWGDEETTSLPAISVAKGQGPYFPSGMEYRRALPHTYVIALSARVFGIDRDFAYRVPSAIFGIATILIMFFGSRYIFGTSVALIVTGLLAFSESHILLSRTARMYGPLLFFTLIFSFAALAWIESRRWQHIVSAIFAFLFAATLHLLAVIVLPILIIPFLLNTLRFRAFLQATGLAILLGLGAWVFSSTFVSPPYIDFKRSGSRQRLESSTDLGNDGLTQVLDFATSWPNSLLIACGVMLGIWLFFSFSRIYSIRDNPITCLAIMLFSISVGLSCFLGSIYGAAVSLAILLLMVSPVTLNHIKAISIPAAILILVLLAWFLVRVVHDGFIEGAKASLRYPFPYLMSYAQIFPGLIVMFLIGVVDSVFGPTTRQRKFVRILALAFLMPTLGLGVIRDWAPMRYLIPVYPFVLLVATSGIIISCKWVSRRLPRLSHGRPALIAGLVVLSGVLGGHGLAQAIAHAPANYGRSASTLVAYPDHRAPGCFVRAHLRGDDIVVAEDALEQYWYVGRVDYWLRNPSDHKVFSYLDEANHQRDIYVASRVTTNAVIESLWAESSRRIWVITSGETRLIPDFYLGSQTQQRAWLDSVMNTHAPVLKGRDGLSATYCLNCDIESVDSDPWDYDCK